MNTGQYDRQILTELEDINGNTDNIESGLNQIYSRQAEILTELRETHTDTNNKLDIINTTLSEGILQLTAVIVLCAVMKVIFRNA